MSPEEKLDAKLEGLLEYLRQSRAFDFTGYKRPTVSRRILKRMQAIGIARFEDYIDYLEVHPEEFAHLFNTILINVTAFFRDPAAWAFLANTIIPRLIARGDGKKPGGPIRVWSAGCASGEEAYTIAMVLAEALSRNEFRRRVKIYATDADDEALATARQAMYTAKELEPVPEELREKYFEPSGGRYAFNSDLRRAVIFGRHDLVQDAPMSRLDLLICRNVLIYFNTEAQARILGRFNYALKPDGFLFLGRAEVLRFHAVLFTPVDLKQRIFSKVSQVSLRDRLLVFAEATGIGAESDGAADGEARVRDAAFEAGEAAQVVVAADGALAFANHQARQIFGVDEKEIGRPFQDIELSYRPIELRSLIEEAYARRQMVSAGNVEHLGANGERRYFEVRVTPLENDETLLGACITFNDLTRYHDLEGQAQRAREETETVHEELQSVNEELQSANEELETTNEELQSSNEELETTNEELQSTNEELETMNEELQSANEELQTINEELQQRTEELKDSAQFLTSILSSLRGGVVVVDRNFSILVWNALAEELWGVRADEVKGRSLFQLDIGLPVEKLRDAIRLSMTGDNRASETILEAINRRGRPIRCRVTIHPFQAPKPNQEGAVLMMEEMGM
jgi:two-component system CheB/CheR fusion protein